MVVNTCEIIMNNHVYEMRETNRLHFSVCVYCNRSQKTSQRVKNNSHATRLRLSSLDFVSCRTFLFFTITRCDVICDQL